MKEIQIPGRKSKCFRKEIQEKAEGNPRKTGRKSKHLSSADPAFSRTYADPHGIFHFLRRFRRCGAAATQALRVRLGLFFGPFFLRFGALRSLSASEGWRRFKIADAWARSSPDLSAASRKGAKREPGSMERPRVKARGSRTRGKRQADRSDVRQEIRPLQKSPNRFPSPDKRTGASPSLPREYLTMPAFKSYPFGSPIARRMRPLSVGRVESAFHPAIVSLYSKIPIIM